LYSADATPFYLINFLGLLPHSPIVKKMASSKVLDGGGNGLESSVHLLMGFTILHEESLCLIAKGLIPSSSHAFIANKHIVETFPSFFGGGEMLDMWQVVTSWKFFKFWDVKINKIGTLIS
jgi:hypothetical protein